MESAFASPVVEVARLGTAPHGWEPPPAAAKADVTEGLYCGNFRFGTLSIYSINQMRAAPVSTAAFITASATARETRLSNAAGITYSGLSSFSLISSAIA